MDNRERRSRIRSSIRDYYDLQASPERQQAEKKATEEPRRHNDPMSPGGGGNGGDGASQAAMLARQQQQQGQELNMDSDQFNSAQYTTKILKEKTLKQLYEKDTELRKKVRELDGDLQDLVYNNYTNFIAATDTIRDMRGNVEDMDQRLHALSTNVERIDDVSKTIRGKLEDHRGKIEEVLSVNKMLQKIKFLVALPEAMRKFVDTGRYTTAAKYWFAGDSIFKRYSNIASFKATHQECREIAESCYLKLQERIKSTDLEADKVEPIRNDVEALRSLIPTSISITSEGAAETFDEDMLSCLFQHAKEAFSAKVGTIFLAVENAFTKYDADLAAEFSVEGVLKKKKKFNTHRRTASGSSDVAGEDNEDSEFDGPQLDIAEAMEQLKEAAFCLKVHRLRARDIMMSEVPKNFHDLLMQDVFPVVSQILRQVSKGRGAAIQAAVKLLSESLAEIGTTGGSTVGSGNNKKASHASSGAASSPISIQHVLVAKCDPSAKADLLMTCIIRELKRFALIPTKVLKLDQLVDIHDGRHHADEADTASPRCTYTDDAIHLVETLVKDEIRSSLVNYGEGLAARASLDVHTLQQAKSVAIVAILMKLAGKVVVSNLRSALGGTAVETALKQALHSGSKTVCNAAVGQISGFIGTMLTDAVDSGRWNAKSAPSEVSAFLPIVVEEIRTTEYLLHSLAPGDPYRRSGRTGTGSATGSGVSHNASSVTGGQRSATSRSNATAAGGSSNIPIVAGYTRREHKLSLAGNMGLMASKVGPLNCLRPSTVDSPHMLECITLSVLKGWTESVRGGGNGGSEEEGGKVYSKGGFQQMQVDCSYLLLSLKEGVEGQSMAPAPSSANTPAMPVVPVATGQSANNRSTVADSGPRYALLCHKDERLVEAATEMLCSVYERCTEKVALPPAEIEFVSRQAFTSAEQ